MFIFAYLNGHRNSVNPWGHLIVNDSWLHHSLLITVNCLGSWTGSSVVSMEKEQSNEENCVPSNNGTEDQALNIRITATVKNGHRLMPCGLSENKNTCFSLCFTDISIAEHHCIPSWHSKTWFSSTSLTLDPLTFPNHFQVPFPTPVTTLTFSTINPLPLLSSENVLSSGISFYLWIWQISNQPFLLTHYLQTGLLIHAVGIQA